MYHGSTMETVSIILILATGIAVVALSTALDRLWAAVIPSRVLYLALRAPGVILHECAHMLGCLVTGARIRHVVLFSREGGSVTYEPPALPLIGDLVIGTAPLFLLPLVLSLVTQVFSADLGCVFPAFPQTLGSADAFAGLLFSIARTFPDNLTGHPNPWFLLYLYITVSLVLSIAPSMQDLKNAATGSILLIIAGALIAWSGVPWAVSALGALVQLFGYGFTLGIVYGLVALAVSLPLMLWYLVRHSA